MLFSARTTTVTVYCWRLTGPLTGEGSGDGAVTPPQKILGLFHLKWLVLVQIPLYILTEMLGNLLLGPQQLHVYMYSWRLRGFDRTSRTPPPRYGPVNNTEMNTTC